MIDSAVSMALILIFLHHELRPFDANRSGSESAAVGNTSKPADLGGTGGQSRQL
jgi:hypothetical protein